MRFIPTCVGNSMTPSGAGRIPTVHPHMRGELRSPVNSMVQVTGSSPHSWGTHGNRRALRRARRFIPTCVGNSAWCRGRGHMSSVHPHMRGELGPLSPTSPFSPGSSPHAWGTHGGTVPHGPLHRFIPTCVGNSGHRGQAPVQTAVHPHMRGELWTPMEITARHGGSSPHAWGTPHGYVSWAHEDRFIPTCVGNSSSCGSGRQDRPVHPHMRGELMSSILNPMISAGSSPHAWGTLRHGLQLGPEVRFIPTCVGNSTSVPPPRIPILVHPHMRGELHFSAIPLQ